MRTGLPQGCGRPFFLRGAAFERPFRRRLARGKGTDAGSGRWHDTLQNRRETLRHILPRAVALILCGAAPVAAQQVPTGPVDVGSISELASMAQDVGAMAADKLLVRDMLGQPLLGEGGETVGTVEDFVVVPGGRIVAALVETQDGSRIAVPFTAVKLGQAASSGMMQVPLPASELTGAEALRSLASQLTGG